MSAQVYSVSGQTEKRRKAFLDWTSIVLSSKLSCTCGGNVNYYKRVHNPIPTLPVGIGKTFAIFKTKLFPPLSVQIYSLLGQTEVERKAFMENAGRGPHLVAIKDEKVSPFVKFETIPPILCFL